MRPVGVRRQSRRERMAYSSSGWPAAVSSLMDVEVVFVEVEVVVARRARFLVGAILRLTSLLRMLCAI